MIGNLRRKFGSLVWRLTGVYVAVSAGIALLVAILVVAWSVYTLRNFAYYQATMAGALATRLRPAYEDAHRSPERLLTQLYTAYFLLNNPNTDNTANEPVFISGSSLVDVTTPIEHALVVVLDADGRVLAGSLPRKLAAGAPNETSRDTLEDVLRRGTSPLTATLGTRLAESQPAAAGHVISLALRGVTDVNVLHSWIEPEHSAVAAAPVIGSNGQVLGAVYVRDYLPALGLPEIIEAAGTLAQLVIAVAALSAFSGLLYAVIVTRHLSKRLRLLSAASMAFAQGDLSRRAAEDAPDEIGELGRQFNRMADTLTQQRIQLADEARSNATAAERSRLARELHDSVKQHVFAASLKLGAAQSLWAQDSNRALALASGAAHAIEQAKQELAVIIPALSPPELEHGGLVRALQTYARNWSIETGIAISTQLATNVPPMSHQHEQVFFRVAQEALNNVARHSGATQVQLALHCHNTQVALSIGDNGRGFDAGDGRHYEGFGLRSMRERAEAVDGQLRVHSTPTGTTIVLSGGAYS